MELNIEISKSHGSYNIGYTWNKDEEVPERSIHGPLDAVTSDLAKMIREHKGSVNTSYRDVSDADVSKFTEITQQH